MNESKIFLLVLHAQYTSKLSYFDDWLDAIEEAPEFVTTALNIIDPHSRALAATLIREAELTIILHSANGDTLKYLNSYKDLLQRRTGKLLSFVGNEVNLPGIPMGPKIAFLREVEADFIATQLLLKAGQWLYAACDRSHIVSIPHALNVNVFRPEVSLADRPIDIGTRARRYNLFLGDDDRNRITDFFANSRFDPPLRVDIAAESDRRFDRSGWSGFLNRCKGTVATEAGTMSLERDDRTVEAIRAYLASRRNDRFLVRTDSPWRKLARLLPASVRAKIWRLARGVLVDEATIATPALATEIHERFFKNAAKPPIYSKCISSRHFDAIGTQTCQIMFPGRFNDILRPEEHYIPLKSDFSDVDEALRKFRDTSLRQAIVRRSYEYVMDQHTYRHRVRDIVRLAESN